MPTHVQAMEPWTVSELRHAAPRGRRAYATLLYGDSLNATGLVLLQARSLANLLSGSYNIGGLRIDSDGYAYDHVILANSVPKSYERMMLSMGSKILHVPLIKMPVELWNSTLLRGDALMGEVWASVFTKLHIWNMSDYDQVAFLDSDALPTHAMPSAGHLFRSPCPPSPPPGRGNRNCSWH